MHVSPCFIATNKKIHGITSSEFNWIHVERHSTHCLSCSSTYNVDILYRHMWNGLCKCSLHTAYRTKSLTLEYAAFHQLHTVAKCQHRVSNQFISNQSESKLWHSCTEFFFSSFVYGHFTTVLKNELIYMLSFRQLITCIHNCGLRMRNLKKSNANLCGRWR